MYYGYARGELNIVVLGILNVLVRCAKGVLRVSSGYAMSHRYAMHV